MKAAKLVLPLLLMIGSSHWLEAQTAEPLLPTVSATDAGQPFRFQFPRDLYDHPGYQTEWWYYTANLHAKHGKQYGFELTFFHTYQPTGAPAGQPPFIPIIFADLAVSDLDGQQFFFTKRWHRKRVPWRASPRSRGPFSWELGPSLHRIRSGERFNSMPYKTILG